MTCLHDEEVGTETSQKRFSPVYDGEGVGGVGNLLKHTVHQRREIVDPTTGDFFGIKNAREISPKENRWKRRVVYLSMDRMSYHLSPSLASFLLSWGPRFTQDCTIRRRR